MLPPVLEVYVVWHPSDEAGRQIAAEFVQHFRGSAFTGLIGGAVEVFIRSEGWTEPLSAPRPIPIPGSPLPNGVQEAQFTAIVPLLGTEMAAAVQSDGPWRSFIESMKAAQDASPKRVAILPYRMNADAVNGTDLGTIIGGYQCIAGTLPELPNDNAGALRCRDLSQALAQFVSGDPAARLTAFISHTKRGASTENGDVKALVALVLSVIQGTHLQAFFDASDLQPGTDWSSHLQEKAASSALLALRSDLYASREWCQKEVLLAKRNGMPVIILDALGYAEERGSFLMDHVPRAPVRFDGGEWSRRDVYRGLNLLVDECLKRALWAAQYELAKNRDDLEVTWWAPHAPEPVTLAHWLEYARAQSVLPTGDAKLRILHPDPPLGSDEKAVLEQMLSFGGCEGKLDVMTPRQLAARGG